MLAVLAFHYFGRWTDGQALYPYGSIAPWTQYGAAGVDLFFVISGFVIFVSLQSSRGFWHFAAKRADRLVLPILVLSTITFVTLTLLPTPFMDVKLVDILPSWTLSHPVLFKWLDPNVGYVDGAYWTLFYEVRFYVLIAALWFFVSRERTPAIVVVLSIGLAAVAVALRAAGLDALLGRFELLTMYPKLPLFAIGVMLATIHSQGASWQRFSVVAILLLSAVATTRVTPAPALLAITLAVSSVAVRSTVGRLVFAWRPLTYVGMSSYSLYLIHQNVGVALIHRLPDVWPLWGQLLGVAGVATLMLGIARLSYRYLEGRKMFTPLLRDRAQAGGIA